MVQLVKMVHVVQVVQVDQGKCGTSDTCGEWYMCLLKLFGSLGSLSHGSLMVPTAGGVCKHFISVYEINELFLTGNAKPMHSSTFIKFLSMPCKCH